jgi:hypothetical protein
MTTHRDNPFAQLFPRQRLNADGEPAAALPPIRKDELAKLLDDFKARGGEVQRLSDGFACGTITNSYGPILQ